MQPNLRSLEPRFSSAAWDRFTTATSRLGIASDVGGKHILNVFFFVFFLICLNYLTKWNWSSFKCSVKAFKMSPNLIRYKMKTFLVCAKYTVCGTILILAIKSSHLHFLGLADGFWVCGTLQKVSNRNPLNTPQSAVSLASIYCYLAEQWSARWRSLTLLTDEMIVRN